MPAASDTDLRFMREAIALAAEGRYSTSPNPAVGCVIVRDGTILARGFHARAGGPHAEAAALAAAAADGVDVRGATAYVSLEPCNHHGRTGPCAEALIAAGIARVVYAEDDPNPAVAGGGAGRLREAGIAVEGGVGAVPAGALNRGFIKRMRSGLPRVRVKLAMSLDGAVALASGESQWITGPTARAEVQRLRAESCAVMTGVGTVLADDPALTVRDERFAMRGRQPLRVILDSTLRTPPTAHLLGLPGGTLIFTATEDAQLHAQLARTGAEVVVVGRGAGGLDLAAVLTALGARGVNELLVEAGPQLAGQVIEARVFDELVVHLAPKLLGREARRAFALASPLALAEALTLETVAVARLGADTALTFVPAVPDGHPFPARTEES
ncbi:MAG: bifunctional diaminohydroxyphosphoribosylaminopyrimidine deaminase/5-amino-6-(5-phosphoribosylamino)uracil reductase RibD [Gammaproteobacteria bacterium]